MLVYGGHVCEISCVLGEMAGFGYKFEGEWDDVYSMAYLHGRNALGTGAAVCVHFVVGLGCCTGCAGAQPAVRLFSYC